MLLGANDRVVECIMQILIYRLDVIIINKNNIFHTDFRCFYIEDSR
jgi:hypothetical protein